MNQAELNLKITMKIRKYLVYGLVIIFFLMISSLLSVSAQTKELTDEEARDKAKIAVKELLNEKFVTVHRLEDLEDSYFRRQQKIRGDIFVGIYVFVASRDGFEITSSGVQEQVVTDGGDFIGYVAVARRTGKVYFLHGFKNKDKEFAKLIKDIPVRIDVDDSKYWGELYFEFLYGVEDKSLVSGWLQLKNAVEENYCAAYWCSQNKKEAIRKSNSWWSAFGKSGLDEKLDSVSRVDNGICYVIYKRLRPMQWSWFKPLKAGDPFMTDWTIRVFPDGRVEEYSEKVIFTIDGKNIGKSI